ncbi:hypothetical protein VTO42DRAFT_1507 [Malbranchea cinnamomea]
MPDDVRDNASDSGDSAIAELEAALRANPDLRAKTPPPREEWEDFEKLVRENPQLAAPVHKAKPATAFYWSKDKWQCGHEGEPTKTDVEREAVEGEQDGKDPATGNFLPEALLTNEIRGICSKCMEKWVLPSVKTVVEGGSSRDPADLPVAKPLPPDVLDVDKDEDDKLNTRVRALEIDDGPQKGKHPEGTSPPPPPPPAADDGEGDDDEYSEDDDDLPPPPGAPPEKKKDDDDDDRSDDEPPQWGGANNHQSVPGGAPPSAASPDNRPGNAPPPAGDESDDSADDGDDDEPSPPPAGNEGAAPKQSRPSQPPPPPPPAAGDGAPPPY